MTTATIKKRIKPITFTVVVTVDKVNENGTFSGCEIKEVKAHGVQGDFHAVSVAQSGGAIYLKTAAMRGIEVLGDSSAEPKAKTKLF